jgi:hypothetical protein
MVRVVGDICRTERTHTGEASLGGWQPGAETYGERQLIVGHDESFLHVCEERGRPLHLAALDARPIVALAVCGREEGPPLHSLDVMGDALLEEFHAEAVRIPIVGEDEGRARRKRLPLVVGNFGIPVQHRRHRNACILKNLKGVQTVTDERAVGASLDKELGLAGCYGQACHSAGGREDCTLNKTKTPLSDRHMKLVLGRRRERGREVEAREDSSLELLVKHRYDRKGDEKREAAHERHGHGQHASPCPVQRERRRQLGVCQCL